MAKATKSQLALISAYIGSATVQVYAEGDAGGTLLASTTTDSDGIWSVTTPTDTDPGFKDVVFTSGTDTVTLSGVYIGEESFFADVFTYSSGWKLAAALDANSKLINNVLDPVSDQDAATKKYVDDSVTAEDLWDRTAPDVYTHTVNDNIIPNSGTGTIGKSGDSWARGYFDAITVNNAPSANTDAANKAYVDAIDLSPYLKRDGSNTITGDILPETDNTHDLGSSSYAFAEMYAKNIYIHRIYYTDGGIRWYDGSGTRFLELQNGGTSARFNPYGGKTFEVFFSGFSGYASNGALDICTLYTLSDADDKLQRWRNGSTEKALMYANGSFVHTGQSVAQATKTTTYTATTSDYLLRGDTSSAGFTITLPTAATRAGMVLVFKKISSDVNTLTIARAGADTIDGATSKTITTQYDSFTLVSDGSTAWSVI